MNRRLFVLAWARRRIEYGLEQCLLTRSRHSEHTFAVNEILATEVEE